MVLAYKLSGMNYTQNKKHYDYSNYIISGSIFNKFVNEGLENKLNIYSMIILKFLAKNKFREYVIKGLTDRKKIAPNLANSLYKEFVKHGFSGVGDIKFTESLYKDASIYIVKIFSRLNRRDVKNIVDDFFNQY